MIGILIGSFIGFLLVWLIFNLWDQIFNVEPYDIDEEDACNDPIFDAIKCPKCGCYNYNVDYMDPLFNTGKYGRCKACGWTFDLPEDSTQGILEAKGNIPR
jgi:hypothetical protein